MGTIHYSQAIKPDTAYLRKIIENSLLCDWAIRIEYHGEETGVHCWQLWDKTFFAIKSAKDVVLAISNCYKAQPRSTIRIVAEKFRPQTRMLFTVYDPSYLLAKDELQPRTTRQPITQPRDQEYDQPALPVPVPTQ
ncbi:ribulose bisphosphate carboxylase small subunit [Kaarinaea lacus]